jgi:hypothetical protein
MQFRKFLEEMASKGEAANLVFEEHLFKLVGILGRIAEALEAAQVPSAPRTVLGLSAREKPH